MEGGDGDGVGCGLAVGVGGGCVCRSVEGGGEEGGVAVDEFGGVGVGFGVGLEERRDVFGERAGLEDWRAARGVLLECVLVELLVW